MFGIVLVDEATGAHVFDADPGNSATTLPLTSEGGTPATSAPLLAPGRPSCSPPCSLPAPR
ncbi:MAG TPA: hypothetical protein VGC30_03045 [Dokdonella sp.]